eukprot:1394469-Amorphochlora_amoeboformis.AAC.1
MNHRQLHHELSHRPYILRYVPERPERCQIDVKYWQHVSFSRLEMRDSAGQAEGRGIRRSWTVVRVRTCPG